MSDLETGAAAAVTASEPVSTEPVQTTEPAQQQAEQPVDLDAQLSDLYDKANIPRGEDGKFAPRNPQEPESEQEAAPETVSEGKPEGEASETAKPSIDPPHSLPSELKANWASVPPAMQEFIAKRETEAHRAITQLGQQVKAYEPFAKMVESNRDVFQNHRRNVPPEAGIQQLLDAQRQLDRDPIASIAHIAKVYGVDLSVFGNQSGEPSSQSPQLASLNAQLQDLVARNTQLEWLVMTREEREAQAQQQALNSTVEDFLKANPIDEALIPDVVAHIEVLKRTAPQLSQKEMMQQAYERALWSDPVQRAKQLAKERADEEAKKAKEQAETATKARRAASVNVKSSPGAARAPRSLDDDLSAIYDQSMRA